MKGFKTKIIMKGEKLKEIKNMDIIEMKIVIDYTIPS
jgi:hypothetical protein